MSDKNYLVRDDDDQPVTREWIETQEWQNQFVRVEVVAANRFYDAIEIWNHPDKDDPEPCGILAVMKYPILRGDVRRICFGLGIAFR